MSTVTFRPDPEAERALAALTMGGKSRSAAIRDALVLAARHIRADNLAAESAALAADPDDVAEIRRVQADLEPLRAW